ncbi:MAG: CDP-alcohol phosphatidyltransferase family protein [Roseobacter sp.]
MSERRPITSRDTKLAALIARKLANSGVSPNRISQASMAFAAFAGAAFWASSMTSGLFYGACLILAALFCQVRLLCNLFDGMVAVEGGKAEPDGPFWNEMPDRVADVFILVGVGLGSGFIALGWAAAALAVGCAYIRELGSAQGLAANFQGPMAKPQRMAVTTGAALLAIFSPTIFGWAVLDIALWIIAIGSAVTILRRSSSIIASLKARDEAG